MSHWNHRVVRRKHKTAAKLEEIEYGIYEAYYKDGEPPDGTPYMITMEPKPLTGIDHNDLAFAIKSAARALEMPTIDYETRKRVEQ